MYTWMAVPKCGFADKLSMRLTPDSEGYHNKIAPEASRISMADSAVVDRKPLFGRTPLHDFSLSRSALHVACALDRPLKLARARRASPIKSAEFIVLRHRAHPLCPPSRFSQGQQHCDVYRLTL